MYQHDRDPSYLGTVASVAGSSVSVRLAPSVASGLSIIDGQTYRLGQVGSFVRIPLGYQDLIGVVTDVGADAVPEIISEESDETGRWMKIQLVGESLNNVFERGVSQYPNVGDYVHITTESSIKKIYRSSDIGNITVGNLSSAENIPAKLSLDQLVTRHSAILGSTGTGKSTTVASLIRSMVAPEEKGINYPNARILLLDIHGEYSAAFKDIATIFAVDPQPNEQKLQIPYWALNFDDLFDMVIGRSSGSADLAFGEKIVSLKTKAQKHLEVSSVDPYSITVDTPLPFSLKQLWYDLIDTESRTYNDKKQEITSSHKAGSPDSLIPPEYEPAGLSQQPPFKNRSAKGILRQLNLLRARLKDRRYDFLLHPGGWEPDLNGTVEHDLDTLLYDWIGQPKPLTILDLSGIPSAVLDKLVGCIIKIVYDSLFWGREKSGGTNDRPLLIVLEEAHRYLSADSGSLASRTVQNIVKEGRKYGVGAMIVSQRPSEVDETILSQCGTFFALRLSNPQDRKQISGTLPDSLANLLDVLPVLRVGEAIILGEAARLPMRCRVSLPAKENRPHSSDPPATKTWIERRQSEGYKRIVASWRSQNRRYIPVKFAKDDKNVYKGNSILGDE